MSDKDFAYSEPQNNNSERSSAPSQSKTSLIVMLAVMFAIACFAVGFFMGEKHGLESNKGKQYEALMKKLEKQQQKIEAFKKEAAKVKKPEAATSQLGELTFYTELPNQSITPEPLNASPKDTPNHAQPGTQRKAHSIINEQQTDLALTEKRLNAIIEQEMRTPTQHYRIQIASFKHEKDAGNLVQLLRQDDIPAEIQQVSLANIGIRYRVLTLPFEQREHALRAKEAIKSKLQITGILITE
ncbi:SPOR domain-containing protein [Ghiorsea bivora]|uniref:SPOR domain-containing protein n=1 Tax=Ghiorsea bivora TaxID=1485545 RepID=UPI00056F042F|nr:SPOR domain-containing protein [Ghiorsea bivora]